MKNSHYRDALAFGWRLATRHPVLWVYGLFAAVLGQMGFLDLFSLLYKAAVRGPLPFWEYLARVRGLFSELMSRPLSFFREDWFWALWLAILFVGLFLHLAVAAVISQGALISAAAHAKSPRGLPKDGREWHAGVERFWELLALNLGRKVLLAFFILAVSLAGHTAIQSGEPADIVMFLSLFITVAVVGVVSSFFLLYAAAYAVVEDLSLRQAVYSAWNLFIDHWLVSFEMGFLFVAFQALLVVVAVSGFIVLLAPAVFLWFFAIVTGSAVLLSASVVLFLALFALFAAFLGSVFTVFSTSVWTHLFLAMHRYGLTSRILHWTSRISLSYGR